MSTVDNLRSAFGDEVVVEALDSPSGMGRRVRGVDLTRALDTAKAAALIEAVDEWQVVCFPGQDRHEMTVLDLERMANHFGAPIPHPSNIDD